MERRSGEASDGGERELGEAARGRGKGFWLWGFLEGGRVGGERVTCLICKRWIGWDPALFDIRDSHARKRQADCS